MPARPGRYRNRPKSAPGVNFFTISRLILPAPPFPNELWYSRGFPMGVTGFDAGREAIGACRGADYLLNPPAKQ